MDCVVINFISNQLICRLNDLVNLSETPNSMFAYDPIHCRMGQFSAVEARELDYVRSLPEAKSIQDHYAFWTSVEEKYAIFFTLLFFRF